MPPSIAANSSPHRYNHDAARRSRANPAGSSISPVLCASCASGERAIARPYPCDTPASSASVPRAWLLDEGSFRTSHLHEWRPRARSRCVPPERRWRRYCFCLHARQESPDAATSRPSSDINKHRSKDPLPPRLGKAVLDGAVCGSKAAAWPAHGGVGDDSGMTSPFLIVQLSDPHIGADWADGDPVAALAAAVESVRALRPQPDAVLVTGDLADHATD